MVTMSAPSDNASRRRSTEEQTHHHHELDQTTRSEKPHTFDNAVSDSKEDETGHSRSFRRFEDVRPGSGEARRVSSQASHNSSARRASLALNEVAAPSPVDDVERPDLEAVRSASREERRTSRDTQAPTAAEKREARLIQLFTISHLILFSIFGTLARLGLQALTVYPGAPASTGVLWANFSGCIIMGFLSQDLKLFRPEQDLSNDGLELDEIKSLSPSAITRAKKAVPLYIGLTTGFCGSFTSFSSFCRDVFLALSNDLPSPGLSAASPRNGGDSLMAVLAVILLAVTLSLAGIKAGGHLALSLHPFLPTISFRSMRRIFDSITVVFAFGCWLGAVIMCIWPPDRSHSPETWRGKVILSLVFAPIGCLLRYYLSMKLNGLFTAFPGGTFAVNMLGTLILGLTWDLQHAKLPNNGLVGGGLLGCQVLQGVEDGFCGCLTTVSTWALELTALRRRHAYVYGGSSVIGGVSILIILMGSLRWTVGFASKAC